LWRSVRRGPTRFIFAASMRTLQIATLADCTHLDSSLSSDFDGFNRFNGTRLAD
jgi:hypothetical protein